MRVLLDECLPRRLKRDVAPYQVHTVPEAGLAGVKDGPLLDRIAGLFDCFITIDGSLEFQQKLKGRSFAIIVLRARSNQHSDVAPLAPAILAALATITPGEVRHLP